MVTNWRDIDRWVIGEAWAGSLIRDHVAELCDRIGPRWASSAPERRAAAYIRDQLISSGLQNAALEEFQLDTWEWSRAEARGVDEDSRPIDLLPFNRCPPFSVTAPIVDVGFGTPREIDASRANLPGSVAVLALGFEPFTEPVHLATRLRLLADASAAAAVVVEKKNGRRMEYHSASDWRDSGLNEHPLPTVVTSQEDGALLRRLSGEKKSLSLEVQSRFFTAPTANVAAEITGSTWPDEHLLLGGHHDTVYGAPGGNDNASGTVAVMETARILAQLQAETGVAPGRSIRFVTFSAEEQKLQGSSAYVERHYGPETPPRLAINLDELSTGNMKGVVLGFPHLRDVVQDQLDAMGDGFSCHVMSQLDVSSDHFPFIRAGLDAAHLWRWRFAGRHADAEFHHEAGDTSDKLNVRELKEYVGQLARLLLRLSHVPPGDWPENTVTRELVSQRLEAERGAVVRVF
ncbi:MAG: M28 family metallopeptidase [Dehalococcoidia bacterium]